MGRRAGAEGLPWRRRAGCRTLGCCWPCCLGGSRCWESGRSRRGRCTTSRPSSLGPRPGAPWQPSETSTLTSRRTSSCCGKVSACLAPLCPRAPPGVPHAPCLGGRFFCFSRPFCGSPIFFPLSPISLTTAPPHPVFLNYLFQTRVLASPLHSLTALETPQFFCFVEKTAAFTQAPRPLHRITCLPESFLIPRSLSSFLYVPSQGPFIPICLTSSSLPSFLMNWKRCNLIISSGKELLPTS